MPTPPTGASSRAPLFGVPDQNLSYVQADEKEDTKIPDSTPLLTERTAEDRGGVTRRFLTDKVNQASPKSPEEQLKAFRRSDVEGDGRRPEEKRRWEEKEEKKKDVKKLR